MIRSLALLAALCLVPGATAQSMGPREVDALPASAPALVTHYGPDPLQTGELRLPRGKGPFPVVVVVHGGCWTKGFATLRNTAPLAAALTALGYATWNIEYRQVGDAGGGWPGTFADWAAATDYLRALARAQPIRLDRVAVVGHSAGAHAALWIASRPRLPRAAETRGADPLPIRAALAIDGPGALTPFVGFDAEVCGKPVIAPLLGGTPAERPDRYRLAEPIANLPLGVTQALVASAVLTPEAADAYAAAAKAKGERVAVLKVSDGGHFDIIAPGSPAWTKQVEPFLARVLADAAR